MNAYYELATLFYEWGWGSSFHFASRWRGESFQDSIKARETTEESRRQWLALLFCEFFFPIFALCTHHYAHTTIILHACFFPVYLKIRKSSFSPFVHRSFSDTSTTWAVGSALTPVLRFSTAAAASVDPTVILPSSQARTSLESLSTSTRCGRMQEEPFPYFRLFAFSRPMNERSHRNPC